MGLTKTEKFTKEQNKLAVLLKAMAHPARIAILQEIMRSNAGSCLDLAATLGLAQPTISQHLKELKNAGLIKGTIQGVSMYYQIDTKSWRLLQENLNHFFTKHYKNDKN